MFALKRDFVSSYISLNKHATVCTRNGVSVVAKEHATVFRKMFLVSPRHQRNRLQTRYNHVLSFQCIFIVAGDCRYSTFSMVE